MKRRFENSIGITLVALVVTIVVLLILAGITLTFVFGDNSVLKKATEAKLQMQIAQAREKLEIVLNGAKIEKHTNNQYNENEFLDEYIISKIEQVEIIGDIAVVDGYAFELDRSVPKIGEYVGQKEELVFPEVKIDNLEYATDYKTAKFTIIAREEINGISKIEIIQYGQVIDTFEYSNSKDEITKEYTVQQNGVYTVKAYSKLTNKATTEVKEIIMAVEYSPNGDATYKKEHSTKVTVKEGTDRVKSLKYQWSKELTMPEESTFSQSCNNNSTITGKDMTGTYYLWTLLETQSGKKNICRSEGFSFDNEGPEVSVTSTPESETSFILKVDANDEFSEIKQYEFYVEGKLVDVQKAPNCSYTWRGTEMVKDKECYVIVTDSLGNATKAETKARTKLFTWEKSVLITPAQYEFEENIKADSVSSLGSAWLYDTMPTIDQTTGKVKPTSDVKIYNDINANVTGMYYITWQNSVARCTRLSGRPNNIGIYFDKVYTVKCVREAVYR